MDMQIIQLTQGKVALVDDEDFEWLNQWKWHSHQDRWNWYAMRCLKRHKKIFMHRLILNAPIGIYIDHINHDGLDNRRENLRFASTSQNAANCRMFRTNTSGFRGVSWDKSRKRWVAMIQIDGNQKNLGRYHFKQDAIEAYRRAAQEAFGEFSHS